MEWIIARLFWNSQSRGKFDSMSKFKKYIQRHRYFYVRNSHNYNTNEDKIDLYLSLSRIAREDESREELITINVFCFDSLLVDLENCFYCRHSLFFF